MIHILAIIAVLSLSACTETSPTVDLRPPGTGGIKPPKPPKIIIRPGPDKGGSDRATNLP